MTRSFMIALFLCFPMYMYSMSDASLFEKLRCTETFDDGEFPLIEFVPVMDGYYLRNHGNKFTIRFLRDTSAKNVESLFWQYMMPNVFAKECSL